MTDQEQQAKPTEDAYDEAKSVLLYKARILDAESRELMGAAEKQEAAARQQRALARERMDAADALRRSVGIIRP